MADGVSPLKEGKSDVVERPTLSKWLFSTRSGWLTLWAVIAGVLLTIPLLAPVFGLGSVINDQTRWYFLAATPLLWLPLILFSLDPEETVASGPRLRLPFITSLLLIGLTAAAVADSVTGSKMLAGTPQRVAFFSFFALAFAPRIWNAALFAHHKARSRRAAENAARRSPLALSDQAEAIEQKLEDYRNAESLGAVFATLLFFSIAAGAIYLGTLQEGTSLATGIGQAIFVIVVALFAIIVFLDWIAKFPPLRATANAFNRAAPRMRFLVNFYDTLDTALVRLGAHVAGADHLKTRSRYGILIVTLGCLATLAWYLPAPLGLTPVVVGLVVALSLSRLWAWVEEDRDMASITGFSPLAPQRVGFREDFRDETLLGFIFVLVLLPIAWMQADQGIVQIFKEDGQRVSNPQDFGLWLSYFGFELAKALPIVDWADIYKLGPNAASIAPAWPNGAHAVFLARALVDLILIASLLQAIAIANRNTQQRSLFAVGQIKRLDELVEKSALSRAIRDTRVAGAHGKFDLARLSKAEHVDFRSYDLGRLRQLHVTSGHDNDRRAFIAEIFRQAGQTLDPAIVVAQNIAASHRNELELFKTFEQARLEHRSGLHQIDLHDIEVLLLHLRRQSGLKDFKQQLIDMAEREVAASPEARLKVLSEIGVGEADDRDIHKYIARMSAEAVIRLLDRVVDAQSVADALDLAQRNGAAAFGASAHAHAALISALERRLQELRVREAN